MRENRVGDDGSEIREPGIRERVSNAAAAARELVATRKEIFKEEMSERTSLLIRGAIGFGISASLGAIAILLLTALVASLFALLFGSAWAGILATLVLCLLGIAGAAFFGWKSLSRFDLDFPATRRGLGDDWNAVRAALKPPGTGEEADLEERFRAGSE